MRPLFTGLLALLALPALAEDRPFFGVGLRELTKEERDSTGLAQGAVIEKVLRDGGAEKAGLRPGDVISRIGEAEIARVADFQKVARTLKVGVEVEVAFVRDGKPQTVKVTPVSFETWNELVGSPAAPIEFREWIGEGVKWEELKGKVVVLDFFQII